MSPTPVGPISEATRYLTVGWRWAALLCALWLAGCAVALALLPEERPGVEHGAQR